MKNWWVGLVIAFSLVLVNSGYSKRYDGRPGKGVFQAGKTRRYVVWEEGGVFKVRTTTANQLVRFHGSVHAVGGKFSDLKAIRMDAGDWIKLSKNKKWIYFNFHTKKGVDGFNFKTDANKLAFFLRVDAAKANYDAKPATEIFLGQNGVHPVNNPFYLFPQGSEGNDKVTEVTEAPVGDAEAVTSVAQSSELDEESKASD